MITDRLPVRIGRLDRQARKHRAVDEVTRLRSLLDGANALIRGLQLQVAERDEALAKTAARQAEAEEIVVAQLASIEDLRAENDQLHVKLAALKAAAANAGAVTVPPMVRDTSAIEDQATAPIDVRPLRDAAAAGLLGPVTDPGRI
ncbi:peptidoglycan hydrolase CwlO-like protein [Streptomyces albaduncus]|uniref:Peptidoglycan hydrolase CwlO-like protein n=2 Tax=Streptomyces griseoloalbus TaxID=67303 RepID=A0A7W8BWI7_9ACTN|nr:hypothetical protein [Streptomyces albaduncus]MBB5130257.1 peptidoglycan hydrolase CwlO-like protein [Streptomyces albaduncus]